MAETDNVVARWEPVFASKPGEEPSTLLFLPLAHVFGADGRGRPASGTGSGSATSRAWPPPT